MVPVNVMAKYTRPAPSSNKMASAPKAIGKLSVISGMRLACMAAGFLASAAGLSSVPHTKQRLAFSAKRVPQVGHIFVVGVGVSSVIRSRIIPLQNHNLSLL